MPRYPEMLAWLAGQCPDREIAVAPASADASFRRYFRIAGGDGHPSLIVMDAPPEHEDCRPFVKVAGLMRDAGLNVPQVLAADLERGFLLLSDLGSRTYLEVIDSGEADEAAIEGLFADARAALVRWQLASREGVLPPYDAALLRRELDLFPEWYVGRHLGAQLDAGQRETLERVFALLVDSALAQPRVFVHRDYMPRNLMPGLPEQTGPGILDFQDAVYGPVTYDIASLLRDAFLSWEEERVLDWSVRYWEAARKAGLPLAADFGDFYRDLEWMGLQRHLKVLGIFARINYRDGKPKYLADTPRFVRYVRDVAGRYRELAPMLALMDSLEGQAAAVGYTF